MIHAGILQYYNTVRESLSKTVAINKNIYKNFKANKKRMLNRFTADGCFKKLNKLNEEVADFCLFVLLLFLFYFLSCESVYFSFSMLREKRRLRLIKMITF